MNQTSNPVLDLPPEAILLDIDDAMRALRISRSRLFQLASSGELKSVQLGRRRLFRRNDLEDFAAGLTPTNPHRHHRANSPTGVSA